MTTIQLHKHRLYNYTNNNYLCDQKQNPRHEPKTNTIPETESLHDTNNKRNLFYIIASVPRQLPGKIDPRRWHCQQIVTVQPNKMVFKTVANRVSQLAVEGQGGVHQSGPRVDEGHVAELERESREYRAPRLDHGDWLRLSLAARTASRHRSSLSVCAISCSGGPP
jgi:IS30 family transposase